jgi:hypothetical protein
MLVLTPLPKKRFMLPVYSALHFIPMLVLRRKSFVRDPIKMLGRAMVGTFRSSSFLAVFIMIYQGASSRSVRFRGSLADELMRS